MNEEKPKAGGPVPPGRTGTESADAANDRDDEPMDEAKARKALRKIAEVQEKIEPIG